MVGRSEFHGVSGCGDVVGVEVVVIGSLIVPSRYPTTPFSAAIDNMWLLHVGQFVPSNLSVPLSIGGILVPEEVMFLM